MLRYLAEINYCKQLTLINPEIKASGDLQFLVSGKFTSYALGDRLALLHES
ncbi:hypothetical protein [Pseudanabaena sp. UWO310]|uniref:hypothetical protein n=1 Tax=Pseudanabaena sp. UWO310 TaxID=2480795 RepID=UPI0016815A99|nr:hypothetical protein [Pseudanabaena sp. UWO310]